MGECLSLSKVFDCDIVVPPGMYTTILSQFKEKSILYNPYKMNELKTGDICEITAMPKTEEWYERQAVFHYD